MSINEQLETLVERLAAEFNTHSTARGPLTSLTTTNKTSIVLAINELKKQLSFGTGVVNPSERAWADIPSVGDDGNNGPTNAQALAIAKRFNIVSDTQSTQTNQITVLNNNQAAILQAAEDATAAANAANDAAINALQISKIGAPNGVAPLDGAAKIPAAYLTNASAAVDGTTSDYTNLAAFPVTGAAKKYYLAKDTGKLYRYETTYIEISQGATNSDNLSEGTTNKFFTENRVLASILAGFSTASVAVVTAASSVLGALGQLQAQIVANLTTLTNHISNVSNPHVVNKTQVGLSNVNNTSDAAKPISTATQTALTDTNNLITDLTTVVGGHTTVISGLVTDVSGLISDSTTTTATTWSSTKVTAAITAAVGDAAAIDDASIDTTHTWSGSYIASQVAGGGGAQQPADWDAVSGATRIVNRPATYPPSTHTHVSTDITDTTSFGRAVMMAASAAALRTAVGGTVPTGGTTGQILKKSSGTDFDAAWAANSGGYTPLQNGNFSLPIESVKVWTIPAGSAGLIHIVCSEGGQRVGSYGFYAASTPVITQISAVNIVIGASQVYTGTTGTAGNLTIAVTNTAIYLENRTGWALNPIVFLSVPA